MTTTKSKSAPYTSRREAPEPRVGFVSLGCPKALVDSEQILTQLRAEGYAIAPSYDGADLVVVNTCGFIDAAVAESLDAIGEALAENGKVIVTGCLGAKEVATSFARASEGARGDRPARDRGSDGRGACASAEAARSIRRSRAAAGDQAHAAALRLPEDQRRLQSPLHVLHHPAMRGDLVSAPIGDVLAEAERLLRAGVKELLVSRRTPAPTASTSAIAPASGRAARSRRG
jgi:ribosomal protein S12 methylthiotransferase